MATPTKHAVCSASSSERWLHCTAAPRFEEQFPPGTSVYAEEGRLAHSFCELAGAKRFGKISDEEFNAEVAKLQNDPLYNAEMLQTSSFFADYLWDKSMFFPAMPYMAQEVSVDFSEYVPDGFGTCDCVMIGGDTLHITDYKHGKGVPVSAIKNSQMRLYALGALKKYLPIFGNAIKLVSMAIVQPRITEEVTEEVITVEELRLWGMQITPLAMRAYYGMGVFVPGEWCRFCRGKAQCRARANANTAFEDFKDCLIEGKMTEEDALERDMADGYGADVPPILSDLEIADLLVRAADLAAWYDDLKEYALSAIMSGKILPGWKVVAGKSNRAFSDMDKAFDAIRKAGYDDVMLYERKPKTLSELEKMIGKKNFSSIAGKYIVKPTGKPTLVEESDKRPPYNSATADFAGLGDKKNENAET